MSDILSQRTHAACDQLLRYGDAVATNEIADLLDALTDLNDDICNGRAKELIHQQCVRMVGLLATIARTYE